MNIKNRVKRGAKFLDKNDPGWEEKIDVDTLALEDPYACVLGQAFSNFYDGKQKFGLSDKDAAKFGFTIEENLPEVDDDYVWSALTEEWVRVINRRLYPTLDGIPEPPQQILTVTFSPEADTTQILNMFHLVDHAAAMLPEGQTTVTLTDPN